MFVVVLLPQHGTPASITVSNEGKRHCGVVLLPVENELGGDLDGIVDRASMRAHSICWLLDLLLLLAFTHDVSMSIFSMELADEISIAVLNMPPLIN